MNFHKKISFFIKKWIKSWKTPVGRPHGASQAAGNGNNLFSIMNAIAGGFTGLPTLLMILATSSILSMTLFQMLVLGVSSPVNPKRLDPPKIIQNALISDGQATQNTFITRGTPSDRGNNLMAQAPEFNRNNPPQGQNPGQPFQGTNAPTEGFVTPQGPPIPNANSVLGPRSETKPEPAPEPLPEPKPLPEPEPVPEPLPEPKPLPEPEPLPEPLPEPKPEPIILPAPRPRPKPEPEPLPEPGPSYSPYVRGYLSAFKDTVENYVPIYEQYFPTSRSGAIRDICMFYSGEIPSLNEPLLFSLPNSVFPYEEINVPPGYEELENYGQMEGMARATSDIYAYTDYYAFAEAVALIAQTKAQAEADAENALLYITFSTFSSYPLSPQDTEYLDEIYEWFFDEALTNKFLQSRVDVENITHTLIWEGLLANYPNPDRYLSSVDLYVSSYYTLLSDCIYDENHVKQIIREAFDEVYYNDLNYIKNLFADAVQNGWQNSINHVLSQITISGAAYYPYDFDGSHPSEDALLASLLNGISDTTHKYFYEQTYKLRYAIAQNAAERAINNNAYSIADAIVIDTYLAGLASDASFVFNYSANYTLALSYASSSIAELSREVEGPALTPLPGTDTTEWELYKSFCYQFAEKLFSISYDSIGSDLNYYYSLETPPASVPVDWRSVYEEMITLNPFMPIP